MLSRVVDLRVGVFCPTLNVYGGGEFVAVVIANTLAQNNYDVIIFTSKKVNRNEMKKFFGETLNPSIKVIAKPSNVQPKGLLDFYQTMFRSYIFKSRCDVCIDTYSNCVLPWTNITYIHFPFLNHFFYRSKFPYLKSRHLLPVGGLPYALIEKNLINGHGKLILANSNYTAEEIRKFSRKEAKVLYPPVPSIVYDENPEKLVNDERENLVVTISRFSPGKNLAKIPLIASLTNRDVKFAIIGRLHHKSTLYSLKKLVRELNLEDRITLLPDISRAEMKEILRRAKVYLHTMIGEHFGISIVEAMAMGCIPIVHNSGGVKEFVPHRFRYQNIRDAAEKIEEAIIQWSPSKAIETIRIAEKFKEEKFSIRFKTLFEDYLNQNKLHFV